MRPDASAGLFDSTHKDTDADLVFASVETLGQEKYLNAEYFSPEDFDYIVIDDDAIITLTRRSPETKAFAA